MTTHKTRFASLDDFLPPGNDVNTVGRNMANYYFFKALMRYGTFDEYHFFVSNTAHGRLFADSHRKFIDTHAGDKDIRVFHRSALPEMLDHTDYTVFHQSDHLTHMGALARIRNARRQAVPITAFIHSLSYPAHMSRYLELCVSGLHATDAILCSSQCGKQVVDQCLETAAKAAGRPCPPVRRDIVPLGIDDTPVSQTKHAARKQLGWDRNEIVGLCFGRFSDFDKMDLFPLLQACRDVLRKGRRMILAGAIHDQAYFNILTLYVRALGLEQWITVIVSPDTATKQSLFIGADFFVSTADNPQETFGLTVLEALHAGTPLVVSDFDGYRELAGDDTGIRVPVTWSPLRAFAAAESIMDPRTLHRLAAGSIAVDVRALSTALSRMYSDDIYRQRCAAAAQNRFATHFSHASIISKLETLWCDLKQHSQASLTEDPLNMDIFKTFQHYVTRPLSLDTPLQTTAFSRELTRTGTSYPLLPSMADTISLERVAEIIARCAFPIRHRDLLDRAPDPDLITYHVLWMLKHDLLQVASSGDPLPSATEPQ